MKAHYLAAESMPFESYVGLETLRTGKSRPAPMRGRHSAPLSRSASPNSTKGL